VGFYCCFGVDNFCGDFGAVPVLVGAVGNSVHRFWCVCSEILVRYYSETLFGDSILVLYVFRDSGAVSLEENFWRSFW
jgi:hypothetical protein